MSVSTANMRLKDIRPAPCEIEYKNMKFLITDRPTDQNIHTYIQVWILLGSGSQMFSWTK
jgi:protein tyrosine phosphatase type 4A